MAWLLYVALFPNGKRYFGVTSKSLGVRIRGHRNATSRGSRLPVHKAMQKLEAEFKTLVIGHRDYILYLEAKAIQAFDTRNRTFGYNVTVGGEKSPMATPEVAARVGLKHRGKIISKEMREKQSKALKGRAHSQERKDKIGAAHKGRTLPRAQVEKILANRKWYRHGPEALAKMSAAMKGNKHAERRRTTSGNANLLDRCDGDT